MTRFFAIYGTGATFHLSIPVCTACRRTIRRRPSVFFMRLLVLALTVGGFLAALLILKMTDSLYPWIAERLFPIGAVLGLIATLTFYWLRRPKPPQTSFYQPVRIRQATMKFADVMGGHGQVDYMKLAFTNPDYLSRVPRRESRRHPGETCSRP